MSRVLRPNYTRILSAFTYLPNLFKLKLVRILTIPVMLTSIAPAHTPSARPKESSTRIDNRARPHLLPSHFVRVPVRRGVEATEVTVDIDILPVSLRRVIDFVVKAQVGELLDVLVPPIPTFAVIFRVSESMQTFRRSEVPHRHDLVFGRAAAVVQPRRHAREIEVRVVRLQVLDHLGEVLAQFLHARGEDAQRVVASRPDQEHDDVAIGRFATVFALGIRRLAGVLFHDHIVHVDVTHPADGHGVGDEGAI